MERKIIKEQIYHKYIGDGSYHPVKFSDLPSDLLPTDIIEIVNDEGYYSENNSWDAFTAINVYRERLENDVEFAKSVEKMDKHKAEMKARRYESYLRLKSEFENNIILPETPVMLKLKEE